MNSEVAKGIIELGNVNLKCLIFQINSKNSIDVLSTSFAKSEGIHNGVVVNLNKASNSIRQCIANAEKNAKISLKKITVILEQPEFLCTKFSKNRKINGSKIHKDDIEFLLSEAKKQVTLNDRNQSIIHIFNHNYVVDGKKFIEEPIGVYADSLSHEMTFITMPKNNMKNINQAFIDCDIEVERFISSIFSLAAKLLDNEVLQSGCSLIDIGFEKISLGVFKNLAIIHSFTFPIGINHITKDISKVCSLTLSESERIMKKIDFSFQDAQEIFDENNILKTDYFETSNFRKISKSLIFNIVQARLSEVFELIKKQFFISNSSSENTINIYLTGGGANLKNLTKYFENSFKCKINLLQMNSNNKIENEFFLSCLGALKIINDGWETEAIPEPIDKDGQKFSFFSRFFKIKP